MNPLNIFCTNSCAEDGLLNWGKLKKGVVVGAEVCPACVTIDPVIPLVAEVAGLTVTGGDEGAGKAAAATVECCSDDGTVAEVAVAIVGV